MSKVLTVPQVQKRLLKQLAIVGSWEKLAARYSNDALKVNRGTLWSLAKQGLVPTSQELRYRLGLERRPVPKVQKAPSPIRLAWLRMADETWKVLKWKPSTKFVKKGVKVC